MIFCELRLAFCCYEHVDLSVVHRYHLTRFCVFQPQFVKVHNVSKLCVLITYLG